MVGLLMARGGRSHIRHHHISRPIEPGFHLGIRIILHEVQHMNFRARNALDLLQIHTQNRPDFLALPRAQCIDPLDRHLTPSARCTAQIHNPRPGHQKPKLIIKL
jgi:hypothetical protein